MSNRINAVLLALALVSLIACGGSDTADAPAKVSYLPDRVEAASLDQSSDIRLFVGDSLWEYINGGAELYHAYGFADVATADYKSAATELVLDLYRFDDPDGAYGLYTALRPDEPETVSFGVEGYFTGSSLEFVKGVYVVRMVAYDESEATAAALKAVAAHMAESLPGGIEPPAMFELFPEGDVLPYTDKIVGEGFLGQAFLDMIYTRDYQLGADTVTLFLGADTRGEMMAQWFEQISEVEKAPVTLADLPFDDNYYIVVSNNFYGEIMAGLTNGKLAGVINFSDQQVGFVNDWLSSMPTTAE